MSSLSYNSRKTKLQEFPPQIKIVPTPETQAIYNQIREDEIRHCQQHPHLAHSPEASAAAGRRPRDERAGLLKLDKRFKTAIKRKLGFVCEQCKRKKVAVGEPLHPTPIPPSLPPSLSIVI